MKKKEKVIAIRTLPVFQILIIFVGLVISAYVNGKTDWLHHSISYLAVITKAEASLALTIFFAVLFGYPFIVFCIWILHGREAVLSSRGRDRAYFVIFSLAYLFILLVALFPTTESHQTINFYIHHFSASSFFLLFPFGALALSMSLGNRYETFRDTTVAYFILYFTVAPLLFVLTKALLIPELVCMSLIGIWSLSLAQIVAKEILNPTSKEK